MIVWQPRYKLVAMKDTPSVVSLFLCLVSIPSTVSFQQKLLEKNGFQENSVFLENLVFETEAASAVDCAVVCWKTPGCLMVTMTVTSPGVRCRGHHVLMATADGRILTDATSLWHVGWLERPCSSDGECDVPLSECFAARCLCSPGYYYSNSNNTCVEGCELADLQSTVVAYPGHRIVYNNIGNCLVVTREECVMLCGQHALTRTCDYFLNGVHGQFICCLQDVAKLDDPSSWIVDVNSVNYQRTCV